MTPDELLQPRYKVIADYPKQDFEVGEVLYEDNEMYFVYTDNGKWQIHPEWYPHLFKKLAWHEERNIEDLPEYVKLGYNNRNQYVHQVDKWFDEIDGLYYQYLNKVGTPLMSNVNELLPSTQQEYEAYLKQMK